MARPASQSPPRTLHSPSPFRRNWKTHRCRYYNDTGEPSVPHGCRRGSECVYAHPSDKAWKSAKRVLGFKPEGKSDRKPIFHSHDTTVCPRNSNQHGREKDPSHSGEEIKASLRRIRGSVTICDPQELLKTLIKEPVDAVEAVFKEIAKLSFEATQTRIMYEDQKTRANVLRDLYVALEHTSPSALPDIAATITRMKEKQDKCKEDLRAQSHEVRCLWEEVFTVFLHGVTNVLRSHFPVANGSDSENGEPKPVNDNGWETWRSVRQDEGNPPEILEYESPSDRDGGEFQSIPSFNKRTRMAGTTFDDYDTRSVKRRRGDDSNPSESSIPSLMEAFRKMSRRIDEQDIRIQDLMNENSKSRFNGLA